MENTLINNLKLKMDELKNKGVVDAEIQRNTIKGELHYYVLNFVYNHPQYSKWIMYGGSALRICYGLNRMSVDLDFEVKDMPDLEKLKNQLTQHFKEDYNINSSVLDIAVKNRGLELRFNIARELNLGQASSKIYVEIDFNEFSVEKVRVDTIPINRGELSFVIRTYNLGGLMASKIAALFGRKERGRGETIVGYKGRDVYDLLWYMEKKILPDLDYLRAKNNKDLNFPDYKELFDKLTAEIGKLNDSELKEDLPPLFDNQDFVKNWLRSWREGYFKLKNDYEIHKAKNLLEIHIWESFETDNFTFDYIYETDENDTVAIRYRLSNYWLMFKREGEIDVPVDNNLLSLVSKGSDLRSDRLDKYITLFSKKTDSYLKKANYIVLGKGIITRLIRMTADNFDHQDEIVLDKSALLSCELEDLMK